MTPPTATANGYDPALEPYVRAAEHVAARTAVRKSIREDYREIGSTGLNIFAGIVADDFLHELQGQKAIRTFRRMAENDAIVGAVLFAIDMWLRQVEWRMEPNPDAQRREKRARELISGDYGKTEKPGPPSPAAGGEPGAPGEPVAEGEEAVGASPTPGAAETDVPEGGTSPSAVSAASPGEEKPTEEKPGGEKPDADADTDADDPDAEGSKTEQTAEPNPDATAGIRTATPDGALPDLTTSPTPSGPGGPDTPPRPPSTDTAPPRTLGRDEVDDLTRHPTDADSIPERYRTRPTVPLPTDELADIPAYEDIPPDEDLYPDRTEAEQVADFVWSCFDDMEWTFEETISNVLSMLQFGFAPHEIVYKRRDGWNPDEPWVHSKHSDGKIGWRYLPIRSQDTVTRWEVDERNGRILGVWQAAPPHYREVYIPRDKLLLFRTSSYRNSPEGRSILRNAYRAWYFKSRMEEIEGIGVERDLAGLPIAWVPPELLKEDATDDEKMLANAIKRMVTNVKRNEQEGMVLPQVFDEDGRNKLFDFELLNSGGRRNFDISGIISRYDRYIAMCVLADFVLLGHEGGGGTESLSTTKVDVFQSAVEAWVRSIAEVFNRDAIPRLCEVNGIDPSLAPRLTYGKVGRVDLTDLGAFLVQLTQAKSGGYLDPALDRYLREYAGLPVSDTDDEDEEEGGGDVRDLPPEMQAMAAATQNGEGMPPEMAAAQAAPPPGPAPGFPAAPSSAQRGTQPPSLRPPPVYTQRGKVRGPYTK